MNKGKIKNNYFWTTEQKYTENRQQVAELCSLALISQS
jgi:hypothetical protein